MNRAGKMVGAGSRRAALQALALVALALAGCGGSSVSVSNNTVLLPADACTTPAYDSTLPFPLTVKHAFIVVLENQSFEKTFDSASMPYLNQLAHTYAYASGYFADSHPSLPNYFFLTAGKAITDSDSQAVPVTEDNIVRHLVMAGKTWEEYSEGLPSVGYDGGDSDGYIEHHNPLSYFSDVRNDANQKLNLVPFDQLATDLANKTLPDYAFIVPNNVDNGHSCPSSQPNCTEDDRLAIADAWLKKNISPLVNSTELSQKGDAVIIIVFDESAGSDSRKGGGRVLWVAAGPDIKRGFVSATCYQHESTLRFMASLIGVPDTPGAAQNAPDMREFLAGN